VQPGEYALKTAPVVDIVGGGAPVRLRVLASERAAPSAHKPGLTQQSSEVKRREPMRLRLYRFNPLPTSSPAWVTSWVEQRSWGAVVLIEVENGRLFGASDPRRPAGAAVAY